ncbi:hypothetical protein [Sphingomonas sp. TDK1]|uniref:hypothetical protein n=1 Tax=Sphingomonas sp. TDK1 TaxID=453247 RepID=UPI0007DA0D43|nr:hypothetical protein [Sphingomonas sp. TDK1]OAN59840.1 hypothetical protein A7X12_01645 [Sphingomonas sp. TDK1]
MANWMSSRRLKVRLAAVLTLAIVAAVVAWRSAPTRSGALGCTPGRQEERDASGKVVRIRHTECLR